MFFLSGNGQTAEDELIRLFTFMTSNFDGEVTGLEDRYVVDIAIELLSRLKTAQAKQD